MSTTYLSKFLSIESEDVLAEAAEDVTDVEAVEAAEEAESARQEAEAIGDEIVRAGEVTEQLETQNEAITNIVEQTGGLSEEAATGFDLARRATVAGLGLDPDEGVGAEVVDQAGLESMVVNRGLVSLEANQQAQSGIWATIKKLWNKFVEKCKAAFKWFIRLFSFVDKKYKQALFAVKDMSEEEYKAKMDKAQGFWNNIFRTNGNGELRGVVAFIDPNGKLFDINKEGKEAIAVVKNITQAMTKGIEKGFNELASTSEGAAKSDRVVKAHAVKAVADASKNITIGRYNYDFKTATNAFDSDVDTNKKGIKSKLKFFSKTTSKQSARSVNVSKKELENALSAGILMVKEVTRMNQDCEADKNKNSQLINNMADRAAKHGVTKENQLFKRALSDAQAVNSEVFKIQADVTKTILEGLKAILSFATRITGDSAKVEA